MMFGLKTKKADLQKELERVAEELQDVREIADAMAAKAARAERRTKEAVVQLEFWKQQSMDYANQVEFWQRKNRELLAEFTKDEPLFDLQAYAKSIEQAIVEARPKPAEIAAVIATADRDLQVLAPRKTFQVRRDADIVTNEIAQPGLLSGGAQ